MHSAYFLNSFTKTYGKLGYFWIRARISVRKKVADLRGVRISWLTREVKVSACYRFTFSPRSTTCSSKVFTCLVFSWMMIVTTGWPR